MVFNLESWAFLVAKLVKNWPAMQETPVQVLGQQDLWRRDRLPTPVFLGFPGGSDSKEFICNVGDLGSIPGLGRFAGGGHGNPLQYSCLENPMDRGAWWATVHGVTKELDRTEQLSPHNMGSCVNITTVLLAFCHLPKETPFLLGVILHPL